MYFTLGERHNINKHRPISDPGAGADTHGQKHYYSNNRQKSSKAKPQSEKKFKNTPEWVAHITERFLQSIIHGFHRVCKSRKGLEA